MSSYSHECLPGWYLLWTFLFGFLIFVGLMILYMTFSGHNFSSTEHRADLYWLAIASFVVGLGLAHLIIRKRRQSQQIKPDLSTSPVPVDFTVTYRPEHGADSQLVCPHCQTKGYVSTQRVQVYDKKPLSSGDLGLARITRGLSQVLDAIGDLIPTYGTVARCSNCGQSWRIN